jgi:hypothetical protein
MGRGVLAFALLMLVVGLIAPPRPYENNGAKQQNRTYQVTSPVKMVSAADAVEPALYKHPCWDTEQDRQSDLCAQWKAADWTKWGVLVGILGTLALLYQIKLTRDALEDTGKATIEMVEANRIARDTMKLQLRPYVSFTENGEKPVAPLSRDGKLVVRVKNFGQTPANDVTLFHQRDFRLNPVGWAEIPLQNKPNSFGKLSHGDHRDAAIYLRHLTPEEVTLIESGKGAVLLRLKLTYEVAEGEMDGDDITVIIDQRAWSEGITRIVTAEDRERT